MNKLSIDELKERATEIVSTDLLKSISGGTQDACHDHKDDSGLRPHEMA